MTNEEFLDDLERRLTHGGVLQVDEYYRLCNLAGATMGTVFGPVYLAGAGRAMVARARKECVRRFVERIRGKQ